MSEIKLSYPMVPTARDQLANIGGWRTLGRVAGVVLKTLVTHPTLFLAKPDEVFGFASQVTIDRRKAAAEKILDRVLVRSVDRNPSIMLCSVGQMQHIGANLLRMSHVAGLPSIESAGVVSEPKVLELPSPPSEDELAQSLGLPQNGSAGIMVGEALGGLAYQEGPPVLFGIK